MRAKKKQLYIGVKTCGCVTASLIDDKMTTAKDIADFAREMHKSNREVRHVKWTQQEFMEKLKACECGGNLLANSGATK